MYSAVNGQETQVRVCTENGRGRKDVCPEVLRSGEVAAKFHGGGIGMGLRLSSGCFYGDLSKSCEVSGFRLTEPVHPPEQQTHQHSHERAYFSLTLSGAYTKLYGGRVVKCTPRTLVFHPPGQAQSGFCDAEGARSFIIELAPPVLEFVSRKGLQTERVSLFREGPLRDRKSTRLNSSHLVASYAGSSLTKKRPR